MHYQHLSDRIVLVFSARYWPIPGWLERSWKHLLATSPPSPWRPLRILPPRGAVVALGPNMSLDGASDSGDQSSFTISFFNDYKTGTARVWG